MAFAIRCILYIIPFHNGKTKFNVMPWMIFFCVFSDVRLYGVLGNLGGHSLFASLYQLRDLWHNDILITQLLEKMVGKCENPPDSISM